MRVPVATVTTAIATVLFWLITDISKCLTITCLRQRRIASKQRDICECNSRLRIRTLQRNKSLMWPPVPSFPNSSSVSWAIMSQKLGLQKSLLVPPFKQLPASSCVFPSSGDPCGVQHHKAIASAHMKDGIILDYLAQCARSRYDQS